MRPRIHIPALTGFAALEELSLVPWASLTHAYGRGVTGAGIHDDVARALRALAHDPHDAFSGGLYSNICHQGTVYEATAYAVPFLAAIASGDVEHSLRRQLTFLLGFIAIGSSYATENGSRAGAYGEGVDVLIREAFKCSAPRLAAVIASTPDLAEIVHAIGAIAAEPNRTTHAALRAALRDEDEDDPKIGS